MLKARMDSRIIAVLLLLLVNLPLVLKLIATLSCSSEQILLLLLVKIRPLPIVAALGLHALDLQELLLGELHLALRQIERIGIV